MSGIVLPILAVAAGMLLISGNGETVHRGSLYQKARRLALQYIKSVPRGAVIIFDFDDTLFHPHEVLDYEHTGARQTWGGDRRALPIYKPIHEMVDVLQVASAMGHYIVLITARHDNAYTRAVVNANFRRRGMKYNLFYAAQATADANFKAALRKQLAARYRVVLTIGDQWGDVKSPGQAHWIKLPDRHDHGMYSSL